MDNANDSVRYSDYCTLRGTAAEGCADRWLAAVRKDSQKRFTSMDPMVRLQAKPQFERWVAGRYQTLLLHEKREVRQGRIIAIDNSLLKGAADTSNAVVTDATTEAESLATDRANAFQLLTGDALTKRTAELDRQRQEGHLRRMAQIAFENGEREKLIDDATEQGLYSPEEGEARKMRMRHDVYDSTVRALIGSNNEDTADAMLDALESKPNGKNAQTLASLCGLSVYELTGYRSSINGVRKRKASEADAKARTVENEAISDDVDTFNKTVVSALDPNFVPPFSKEEKLAELSRDTRLSPSARQKRMAQWGAWFDTREADAVEKTNRAAKDEEKRAKNAEKASKDLQEERAKNGYELTLVNGKSVWISASRWGQTQADVHDWFTTDAIARDPVKAIVRAESLKATGSISKEDYEHTLSTATALQNPKTVEAANKALGGNFFALVDTKKPKKSLPDYTDEGADFAADLAYKYDPTAKTGFTGSFQTRGLFGSARPSSLTDDMRQLDKSGERLFTPEEKTTLFREIGWMVSRGYTPEQIDAAVQRIVAPKMQLYYNMTMQERLADETFIKSIRESVTSFDDTVNANVSAITGKKINKVR